MTSRTLADQPSHDRRQGSRHGSRHGTLAQLLISWSPLSTILLAYGVAHWINAPIEVVRAGADLNRLGFGAHVAAPAAADRAVFGTVPSVWLQDHLVDLQAQWYDAVAALIYVTHLVAIPVATSVVWFRLRDRFGSWLIAVLAFTLLGMSGYVLYPAAPPWLAAEQDVIGSVDRVSARGWEYLHLGAVQDLVVLVQAGSNPVAAMPSLHAGSALLVAVFLWPFAGRAWRIALLGYPTLMAGTLVYTGEHYVVDVAAGWVTALAAAVAGLVAGAWSRSRPWRRSTRPCPRSHGTEHPQDASTETGSTAASVGSRRH